ncbi:hypothetical protein K3495_g9702 [Podosphaera aphanis]|nr:hypothetical protein K3495_g9702 [Podosphaera aphanis]
MAELTGLGVFFIILFLLTIFGCTTWLFYTHIRAKRLGLPQPTFSSYNPFGTKNNFRESGQPHTRVIGWVSDKIRLLKNRNSRAAAGGYEEPLTSNVRSRAKNRGFGPLDPDEAWDTRVGMEADSYTPTGHAEEQELDPYEPSSVPPKYEESRGRRFSRVPEPYIGGSQAGLDRRYDEEMGSREMNPFADTAEPTDLPLREFSPRPMVTAESARYQQNTRMDSPSRRSMFREDI